MGFNGPFLFDVSLSKCCKYTIIWRGLKTPKYKAVPPCIAIGMVMIFVGSNYTCTFLLLLGNIILLAEVLLHILVVVFRMNYEKDENTARH